MEFLVEQETELQAVAQKIAPLIRKHRTVALKGEMGTGKTTLVKYVCRELGVMDEVSSPTFSIANEYHTKEGDLVYHIDLYRLESANEAFNAGIFEYLDRGDVCLIEWPQILESSISEDVLNIHIEVGEQNRRKIAIFNT